MHRSALVTINLTALQHNLTVVHAYAPDSKVICAIKAHAYGHGLLQTTKALAASDAFAVAHINEAIYLRKHNIKHDIIVLQGPSTSTELEVFHQYNLTAVIHHHHQLEMLKTNVLQIKCWVKVNSGMNRLGFLPEYVAEVVSHIRLNRHIELLGLMSHMADADYAHERQTTERQLAILRDTNKENLALSLANSATLSHWPEAQQQWVRPGIMLYGINPFVDTVKFSHDLIPVMSLQAPIIAINKCKKGEKVGYGGAWQARRDSLIAVVAIGYGDGYPRHAQNNTPVSINGCTYPLIGRVSMDLITVDVTDAHDVEVGDNAILWGQCLHKDKSICVNTFLKIEKVAECADTIPYELLCAVYGRVNYRYQS